MSVTLKITGYGRHNDMYSQLSAQEGFRSANTKHALQTLEQYRTTTFWVTRISTYLMTTNEV